MRHLSKRGRKSKSIPIRKKSQKSSQRRMEMKRKMRTAMMKIMMRKDAISGELKEKIGSSIIKKIRRHMSKDCRQCQRL